MYCMLIYLIKFFNLLSYAEKEFNWPVARPIGNDELLEIQILNYNKYLSNR